MKKHPECIENINFQTESETHGSNGALRAPACLLLKRSGLILILLFSLLLSACSSSDQIADMPAPEQPDTVQNETQTTIPVPTQSPTPTPIVVENPDFRNVKWGMSLEEVISIEGEPDDSGDTGLLYLDVDVAGFNPSLLYEFNDEGKLYTGCYFFNHPHTNKNDYIYEYNTLFKKLTSIYGDAIEDREVWKNDLFRDDPSEWGFAVSAGHLAKLARWETDTTRITLILTGDNFDISFALIYESLSVSPPPESTEGL